MSNESDIKNLQAEVAVIKKQLTHFKAELRGVLHEAGRSVERLEDKVKKMR